MNPPDSDIQASHKRAIIDAQQFANKLSIVVLSADKDEVDNLDDAKQDQVRRVAFQLDCRSFIIIIITKLL